MLPTINAQPPLDRTNRLTLVLVWIQSLYRRLSCMVMGHSTVLHFEPRRLALRCLECGHETPGWSIGEFMQREVVPQTRRNMSDRDRAA